jgi:hypothetical protein
MFVKREIGVQSNAEVLHSFIVHISIGSSPAAVPTVVCV